MVRDTTNEDVGNITDAALIIRVILTGTRLPGTVVIKVGFPRWVVEFQEPPWDDRNRILEVGNAGK